jgi:signal transduction histidine kinase
MDDPEVKVLLVEDDQDDYLLVLDFLAETAPSKYAVEWKSSYGAGLQALDQGEYDVCLLDYCLGARTGLDFLREPAVKGCKSPIIFLTGQGAYDVDLEAMRAGAADYLIKNQINGPLLERSIRYAIERKRTEEALRESQRQLKVLSSQLLNAQEDERKRIAKELHDGIGQILTAARFGVEGTMKRVDCAGIQCRQSLTAVISVIQNGIDEIRRISTDLWPAMLNHLGILATLSWYCHEFQNIFSGMRIVKVIEIAEPEIPDPLKITLYRIVQEATNNAAKHSKGDMVSILMRRGDDRLELTISDNGQGFDPDGQLSRHEHRRGMGLSSMRERTELSGGTFSITSIPGKGTLIHASWAVTTPSAAPSTGGA